jgi:phosphonate transport system substrate-binding protein
MPIGKYAACLMILAIIIGCSKEAKEKQKAEETSVTQFSQSQSSTGILRIGFGNFHQIPKIHLNKVKFQEYLRRKMNCEIAIYDQDSKISENELLLKRDLDVVFFISHVPHPEAIQGWNSIAVPILDQSPTPQFSFIVNENSPFYQLKDLGGKSIGVSEAESVGESATASYLSSIVHKKPEEFFNRIVYFHDDDDAIASIERELLDCGVVNKYNLNRTFKQDPSLKTKIRIIAETDPYALPPVICSKKLHPQIVHGIQNVLLSMENDAEGKNLLQILNIDGFTAPEREWFKKARN